MNKRVFFLALLVIVCFVPTAARQQRSDREIIRQARHASYSLKDQGLIELKCTVQPDWDSMYAALKPDEVTRNQVLPILKGTHFTVVLGPDGASNISHESDVPPPNEEVARRVRQSIDNMDQVLTGFFQTWSNVMFTPLLPQPNDDYRLEDLGGKYRVNIDQGATYVQMLLNHELAIEKVELNSPQLNVTVDMQWSSGSEGFVLASYQGNYKPGTAEGLQLSAKIEYEEVEGLKLPSIVYLSVTRSTVIVPLRLRFVDYEVKKR
jgi:hypothetical protein